MKAAFALACIFAVCSADVSLADDSSMSEDEFRSTFGINGDFRVLADEDGEGYQAIATYYDTTKTLSLSGDELDQSVLAAGEFIIFEFNVQGYGYYLNDPYDVILEVKFEDGTSETDSVEGAAIPDGEDFTLRIALSEKSVSEVNVLISGSDTEYWAGNYGARFSDFHLYVDQPEVTLIDADSFRSGNYGSATISDSGRIQFSYYWDQVSGSITAEEAMQLANFDIMTELVFEADVSGSWPDYSDPWELTFEALDASGTQIWSWETSGTGTEETVEIREQWSLNDLPGEDIAELRVTLEGTDAEYWAGNYGAAFENVSVSVQHGDSLDSLMLMNAATAQTSSKSDFGRGFMAGFGASTAVVGMAAYAMYKRKAASLEDGDFQRI